MNTINKIVDVPKLVKRVWIILWITLFIFVIAKLCFNIWYPIVVENETFIKICNFIDSKYILDLIIRFILYITSSNIIFLTCTKNKKYSNKLELIITNVLFLSSFAIKNLHMLIGNIIEIMLIVLFPIIINLKNKLFNKKYKNILFPIIIYILINIWQLNMFFIRGITDILDNIPLFVSYILQIDYYVFITITWIGACYFMGTFGIGWLWAKPTTKLLAMKEAELKKANPDTKLIADIDKELEKRNSK